MQIKISFLLCGIVLLTKIIAIYNTNFDLFGDEAQYWIWSQSPDFGYYSKPPLLAWLITFVTFLFGDSFETLKLISVGMYVLTSIVVYLIFKQLYQDKKGAVLAGLTFYLIPAVSVSSFLISTDILLVFFWSLSLFFLLKIRSMTINYKFYSSWHICRFIFFIKVCCNIFCFFNFFNLFYRPQVKKNFFRKI